jgi:hypothetical protein
MAHIASLAGKDKEMSLGNITAAELALIRSRGVMFFANPANTDLISTLDDDPNTFAINLAVLFNLASGAILAPVSVGAAELEAGALAATVDGRAVMATGYFTEAAATDKFAALAISGPLLKAGAVTGSKLASVGSLFDGAAAAITVLERVYSDGTPQTLLAANGATAGDRLVLVQAHVTEAVVLTSYEWDVGSTTDANGLFDDLFGGDITLGLRESEISAYWLPAGEALVLTEVEQTDGATPAGKVTFRILDMGAITTAKLANDAVTNTKILAGTIADTKLSSFLVKDTGRLAVGLADFNATGDCTSVDIGTQVYTRGVSDPPNGVWDEGANPAASATALAAAINADVRAGNSYAAIAEDTTVFIFAKTAGTAGNVTVVRTGGADPDVVDNLVGGAAATVKQTAVIKHTVTAEEATQVEVHIPLPFTPTTFSAQVLSSAGEILPVTDLFTIAGAPARIKVATNGAVHIASTNVITIVAQE